MKIANILGSMAAVLTFAAAVPANPASNVLESRQDSGCYPFEDPDCCISYTVCQCSNGKSPRRA